MDIFSAILLGVVQGITEFLPISSSGHLIVARELLGIDLGGSLAFDAVLQLATSCAVLIYFWKDIAAIFKVADPVNGVKNRLMLWALVIGTIPAVVVGVFFETELDVMFRSAYVVAWALIVGSIVLFAADRYASAREAKDLSLSRALGIGLFQLLAFIPGFSRSGATISGGLFLNLKREDAVRFSFLLSLPILLGSGLKKLFDLGPTGIHAPLVIGSVVAFLFGLASIHWLIRYLRTHTFGVFIIYRIVLALVIFALF